jgi:hypothetical protein
MIQSATARNTDWMPTSMTWPKMTGFIWLIHI